MALRGNTDRFRSDGRIPMARPQPLPAIGSPQQQLQQQIRPRITSNPGDADGALYEFGGPSGNVSTDAMVSASYPRQQDTSQLTNTATLVATAAAAAAAAATAATSGSVSPSSQRDGAVTAEMSRLYESMSAELRVMAERIAGMERAQAASQAETTRLRSEFTTALYAHQETLMDLRGVVGGLQENVRALGQLIVVEKEASSQARSALAASIESNVSSLAQVVSGRLDAYDRAVAVAAGQLSQIQTAVMDVGRRLDAQRSAEGSTAVTAAAHNAEATASIAELMRTSRDQVHTSEELNTRVRDIEVALAKITQRIESDSQHLAHAFQDCVTALSKQTNASQNTVAQGPSVTDDIRHMALIDLGTRLQTDMAKLLAERDAARDAATSQNLQTLHTTIDTITTTKLPHIVSEISSLNQFVSTRIQHIEHMREQDTVMLTQVVDTISALATKTRSIEHRLVDVLNQRTSAAFARIDEEIAAIRHELGSQLRGVRQPFVIV